MGSVTLCRAPDDRLVEATLAGDRDAFGILVERYRTEFAGYAAGLCGEHDLAADAMQEAFIRAYDSLATCRDPSRFKAWFFRILTNQCHNARDRRRRHAPLDDAVPGGTATDRRAEQADLTRLVAAAIGVT